MAPVVEGVNRESVFPVDLVDLHEFSRTLLFRRRLFRVLTDPGDFGHALTIKHTHWYCRCVTPESDNPIEIVDWMYDPRPVQYRSEDRPYAVATHAGFPGLQIRVEYDDNLILRSVAVTSPDNGSVLTARLLREIPFGAVDAVARAHMAWWWHEFDKGRTEAARTAYPLLDESIEAIDVRRPGRRGRPDIEYAELALDYVKWLDAPDSGSLEIFAKSKFLSVSQIRNLLYEARQRDLLSKAPPGKPGGMLTNKALALLGSMTHSAPRWSPEQIAAMHERDAPIKALWAQLEAGEITGPELAEQLPRLMADAFGDSGDSIQGNPGKD
jgi:hypothetical protein